MNELTPEIARSIINTVGAYGTPPEFGFQYFTAGLDEHLSIIEQDYLNSFIKNGGSAFKMVVGSYGGGKTHFLYSIRELAWRNNYACTYVILSPNECPFHSLDRVYKAIVKNITYPLSPDEILSGYEQGIKNFLRAYYSMEYQKLHNQGKTREEIQNLMLEIIENNEAIESLSFERALKTALKSLLYKNDEEFISVCQWLYGEGYDTKTHKKMGILQKIDKSTAFSMIRSLAQWIRGIGFSGLVILFDEAERVTSLSSKQKTQHLSNLRELIDACTFTSFKGVMIFYAVPDENFLEGKAQIYEALKQRLSSVFEETPTGVKINLENLPIPPVDLLIAIGNKLKKIYEIAHQYEFDENLISQVIKETAEKAYEKRYGDIGYRRLFVKECISHFDSIKKSGSYQIDFK